MTTDPLSPTESALRIGILGAAGIAERAIVEPARDLDGVSVRSIGSRDPERARALAKRIGVPEWGSYDDVLNDPEVDLVYVAIPPTFHAEWAVQALEAGKDVLCEKPLSANGTTAARIADAAAATGRRAFVGFHYRMHSFTQRLLEELTSGALGAVESVRFDFSIPHFVVKPGNIRLDGDLGGGAFMDVGCYAVDLIRAAWGEPMVTSASAVRYDGDPRVDLQTDAELDLPAGARATVRASFIGDDAGSMTLRVVGSEGVLDATSVIVPQWGATLRVALHSGEIREASAQDGESSYARQLAHIVMVRQDGASSILDAARGVGTMRIVDAVYRAAGLQPR